MAFSKDRPLNINNFMHSPLGLGTIQGGIAPPVGCQYELLARFDVANQGLANGQVMGAAEGVTVGNLTVVETDGVADLFTNRLRLSQKTARSYVTLGTFSPNAIVRQLGKTLLYKWEVTGNTTRASQGWHDTAEINAPNFFDYAYILDAGIEVRAYNDSGSGMGAGILTFTDLTANTEYRVAWVLGGYDAANGQPWYSGVAGPFLYGCSLYIKGGVEFPDWALLWRWSESNTTNLYPSFGLWEQAPHTIYYDDIMVPIYDYSSALQPVNADWFTDVNGTSLDAHVPNVGGMWTEDSGGWDIQGNLARTTAGGGFPAPGVATVSSTISDMFCRASFPVGAVYEKGIAFRVLNKPNFWAAVVVDYGGGQTIISEINGGVWNIRASLVIGVLPVATHEMTVICEGQNMQSFVNGANRVTFASAFNQTETKHGLWGNNGDVFDNFHVNRRVGSQYDILDECE